MPSSSGRGAGVLPHDQRVVAGDDVMRARRMGAQCVVGFEHVADIASDDARQGLDVGPGKLGMLFARTKLQPALAAALMQKRETVEIGMRAGTPAGEIRQLGIDHRQVSAGAATCSDIHPTMDRDTQ